MCYFIEMSYGEHVNLREIEHGLGTADNECSRVRSIRIALGAVVGRTTLRWLRNDE